MPTKFELRKVAWEKFRAAKSLLGQKQWSDASYLCGYAVEILLKARICVGHGISQFPGNATEFKASKLKKQGWKQNEVFCHDLEQLLSKTTIAAHIKSKFMREWSTCIKWSPESRYQPVGTATKTSANQLLLDAAVIIRALSDSPGMEAAAETGALTNSFVKVALAAEELMEEHGDFEFFAIWHRNGSFEGSADVVFASPWIDSSPRDGIGLVINAITSKLTPEELNSISGMIHLEGNHPLLLAVSNFEITGCSRFKHCRFNGFEIDHATIVRLKGKAVE